MLTTDAKKEEKTAYEKYIDKYFKNLFSEYPKLQEELSSIHSYADWKNLTDKYPKGKLPDFLFDFIPNYQTPSEIVPENNQPTETKEKEPIHPLPHLPHLPIPMHTEQVAVPSHVAIPTSIPVDEDHIPQGLYSPQQTEPTPPATTQAEQQQSPPQQSFPSSAPERNKRQPQNNNKLAKRGRNAAKQAAKKIAKSALRGLASALAPFIPWIVGGIIAIFIIIVIVLFVLHLFGGNSVVNNSGETTTSSAHNLQATLKGPEKIDPKNADNFIYSLNIQYKGNNNLTVKAPLPQGFYFASSSVTPTKITSADVTWILTPSQASTPLTFSAIPNSTYLSDDITEGVISVSDDTSSTNNQNESKIIDTTSKSLDQMFQDAADNANIPVAFLKSIAHTETDVLNDKNYSDAVIEELSQSEWWKGKKDDAQNKSDNDPLINLGYGFNTCQYASCAPGSDVRGVMQFELKTWNGTIQELHFPDDHTPDRRYVRDAIVGAATFIKNQAQTYDNTFNFSQNPKNWTETQVRAMATTYCTGNPYGNPRDAACAQGGKGYDDIVWGYYQDYNK